ncbi:MAG: hypothetical protein ACFCD0_11265 [Gemmataceae bacterium]
MWYYNSDHPLRRLFAGVTEQTFVSELGVADPNLIDYLSLMLSRFIHMDSLHRLRSSQGKQLTEVVEMVFEAESLPPEGRTRREYHKHIGDFTLFWTGAFAEGTKRLQDRFSADNLVDYTAQGKRSYYIASTFDEDEHRDESQVLRRLSEEFELCAYGLKQVHMELQKTHSENEPSVE